MFIEKKTVYKTSILLLILIIGTFTILSASSNNQNITGFAVSEPYCLIEGTQFNFWASAQTGGVTNVAGDGNTVYMVSYGNPICEAETIKFDLFNVEYDNDLKKFFIKTHIGTVQGTTSYLAEYDVIETYAKVDVTWPGENKIFYFIASTQYDVMAGDTIFICETPSGCSGGSADIANLDEYLSAYSLSDPSPDEIIIDDTLPTEDLGEEIFDEDLFFGAPEDDFSDEEFTDDLYADEEFLDEEFTDEFADEFTDEEFIDEFADEFSESDFLDDEFADEFYFEDETGIDAQSDSFDFETQEETSQDVPIFTWINILIASFILIGYYSFRK
jgi:hypothetical protein